MAELAMLADMQRMVYHEKVTHQLHVMAQASESSPVIDRRSNNYATPPTDTSVYTAIPRQPLPLSIPCHIRQHFQKVNSNHHLLVVTSPQIINFWLKTSQIIET